MLIEERLPIVQHHHSFDAPARRVVIVQDFDAKLIDIGFERTGTTWVDAWQLGEGSAP